MNKLNKSQAKQRKQSKKKKSLSVKNKFTEKRVQGWSRWEGGKREKE